MNCTSVDNVRNIIRYQSKVAEARNLCQLLIQKIGEVYVERHILGVKECCNLDNILLSLDDNVLSELNREYDGCNRGIVDFQASVFISNAPKEAAQ